MCIKSGNPIFKVMVAIITILLSSNGFFNAANAGEKDDAQDLKEVIDDAIQVVVDVCYRPSSGFYIPGDNRYQSWDTAVTLYLFDWLSANGWDLSEYSDEIADARNWLESARHDNGSYTFSPPDNPESCNETTTIAGQVLPYEATNQWIIDELFPDGHWDVLIPAIPLPDYPSVTTFALAASHCLDLDIDWEMAYQWLKDQDFIPSTHYYSTRYYITWQLVLPAMERSDFPLDLIETMKTGLLTNQDADGSFEDRAMTDNPSSIIPTSLALQTAIILDDPDLDALVSAAFGFLADNRAQNGFWWGGLYSDNYDKNESLYATTMTIRALAMRYFRLTEKKITICLFADDDDDDDDNDDNDDDLIDDDDNGDDDNDDDNSADNGDYSGKEDRCGC